MRLTFTISAEDKAQGENVWSIAILDRGFDRQLVECLSVVGAGDVFTFSVQTHMRAFNVGILCMVSSEAQALSTDESLKSTLITNDELPWG